MEASSLLRLSSMTYQTAPPLPHHLAEDERFLEDELVITTTGNVHVLLQQPKAVRADLLALYTFIYYTGKRQHTNQPKCTNTFIAEAFGWGEHKIIKLKTILVELGLLDQVRRIDPQTGKVKGWYLRITYMLKASTIKPLLQPAQPPLDASPPQGTDAAMPQTVSGDQSGINTSGTASRLSPSHTLAGEQPNAFRAQSKILPETPETPEIPEREMERKEKKTKNTKTPAAQSSQQQHAQPAPSVPAASATRGGGWHSLSGLVQARQASVASLRVTQTAERSSATSTVSPVAATCPTSPTEAPEVGRVGKWAVTNAPPVPAPAAGATTPKGRSAKIRDKVLELCAEFGEAWPKSTVTTIHNIYAASNLDEYSFLDWLFRLSAEIREGRAGGTIANPMAYLVSSLRNDLHLADQQPSRAPQA